MPFIILSNSSLAGLETDIQDDITNNGRYPQGGICFSYTLDGLGAIVPTFSIVMG
jgi:hypothetical protein